MSNDALKKPKLADFEHLYMYLDAITAYEDLMQKKHAKARIEATRKVTIYHGHRFVFCVVNSLGMTRYFDKQYDAVQFARDAVHQPTRIIQMPIMPKGYHLTTSLDKLIPLIEKSLEGE